MSPFPKENITDDAKSQVLILEGFDEWADVW